MIRAVRTFAAFWFDFVVGDDWRIAAGVVGLVTAAAVIVHLAVVRAGIVAAGVALAVVVLVLAAIVSDARRATR